MDFPFLKQRSEDPVVYSRQLSNHNLETSLSTSLGLGGEKSPQRPDRWDFAGNARRRASETFLRERKSFLCVGLEGEGREARGMVFNLFRNLVPSSVPLASEASPYLYSSTSQGGPLYLSQPQPQSYVIAASKGTSFR